MKNGITIHELDNSLKKELDDLKKNANDIQARKDIDKLHEGLNNLNTQVKKQDECISNINSQYNNLPNKFTLKNAGTVNDFNKILSQNEYMVGGTNVPNAPYSGQIYGKLIAIVNTGDTHNNKTNWIWHYFINTNNEIYKRSKVNADAWSQWEKIVTRKELEDLKTSFDNIASNIKSKAEDIGFSSNNFKSKNVKEALNELFTNVDNGKKILETAIIDKGSSVSKTNATANFEELKNGIKNIKVGKYSTNDCLTNEDIELTKKRDFIILDKKDFGGKIVCQSKIYKNIFYVVSEDMISKIQVKNNIIEVILQVKNVDHYTDSIQTDGEDNVILYGYKKMIRYDKDLQKISQSNTEVYPYGNNIEMNNKCYMGGYNCLYVFDKKMNLIRTINLRASVFSLTTDGKDFYFYDKEYVCKFDFEKEEIVWKQDHISTQECCNDIVYDKYTDSIFVSAGSNYRPIIQLDKNGNVKRVYKVDAKSKIRATYIVIILDKIFAYVRCKNTNSNADDYTLLTVLDKIKNEIFYTTENFIRYSFYTNFFPIKNNTILAIREDTMQLFEYKPDLYKIIK